MTDELTIRRLDRYAAAAFATFLTADQSLGGTVERIAGATALRWPAVPIVLFNHIVGLGNEKCPDDDEIDRLLALYRDQGLPCYVQLSPLANGAELGKRLAARGLEQHPSWAVMALTPDRQERTEKNPEISVELVDESNRDDFIRTLLDAFELKPPVDDLIVATFNQPDVHGFLARVDGEPAGTGQIVIREGVGGLFSGGVLDNFRRRGIHGALISARINFCLERGVDLLYSETEEVGNQSSRDLTRFGFYEAYQHVNWSLPPPAED